MGYYVRVLSPAVSRVPANDLSSLVQTSFLRVEAGTSEEWEQLVLNHQDGREIALIERNEVVDGSLADQEIGEFIEEIGDWKPISAVAWLRNYLRQVKTVYAFQVLSGVY